MDHLRIFRAEQSARGLPGVFRRRDGSVALMMGDQTAFFVLPAADGPQPERALDASADYGIARLLSVADAPELDLDAFASWASRYTGPRRNDPQSFFEVPVDRRLLRLVSLLFAEYGVTSATCCLPCHAMRLSGGQSVRGATRCVVLQSTDRRVAAVLAPMTFIDGDDPFPAASEAT